MDYQMITREAGPAAARIIETGEELDYSPIDPETLDDQARGALVLGVELIDAPYPDGIIIYLKRPAGGTLALMIETTPDEIGIYAPIEASTATIQEGGN